MLVDTANQDLQGGSLRPAGPHGLPEILLHSTWHYQRHENLTLSLIHHSMLGILILDFAHYPTTTFQSP